jgi:hypothetical protein
MLLLFVVASCGFLSFLKKVIAFLSHFIARRASKFSVHNFERNPLKKKQPIFNGKVSGNLVCRNSLIRSKNSARYTFYYGAEDEYCLKY